MTQREVHHKPNLRHTHGIAKKPNRDLLLYSILKKLSYKIVLTAYISDTNKLQIQLISQAIRHYKQPNNTKMAAVEIRRREAIHPIKKI